MTPVIRNVSDTAFLVAGFRALENDRLQPLFRDPLARKLAGEYGKRASTNKGSASLAWSVAIRTVIVDDFVKQAITEGVGTVLNLGAGLDTRPYRMELPQALRWVDVDLPAIVDYMNEQLADERPNCRLERFKVDLADRAARRELLDEVCKDATKILVLTEWVTPYLTEADVAELADDLRRLDHVGFWIVDSFPPKPIRSRHNRRVRVAIHRFNPHDWFVFFEQHGWRPKATHYISTEAKRLGRPLPRSFLKTFWRKLKKRFIATPRREPATRAAFVLLVPS